jgi:hypothetical protein
MSDYEYDAIDTPEARIHTLASSLYYVASLDVGFTTERVFETLPPDDQAYFERLVRLALEGAAFWRLSADSLPPASVTPLRPVLTLVPKILSEDA